jgi:glucosyl-3-phosphoglycerate phosphatase
MSAQFAAGAADSGAGTRRVILLRHGRTSYNAQGRFQGQTDVPLDDVGLGQAKQAADTLAVLLGDEPVRVVASDLQRAVQTAEAVAGRFGVEVAQDPRLREINAGAWEGLLRAEILARSPGDYTAWQRGDDVRFGGPTGETRAEAGGRAAAAVLDAEALPWPAAGLPAAGGTLICVGHGTALRSAILVLLDVPGWRWNVLDAMHNGAWAELARTRVGWRLNRYNAT